MSLYYYIAWIQSIAALLGSLIFSEIANFAPCTLCWYQRYIMYPLVIILTIGVITKSPRLPSVVIPLSLAGFGIAVYHNLLYWGIVSAPEQVCGTGVSCTTRYVEWFGFITIPLLSALAFAVLFICMILALRTTKKNLDA